MIVDLKKKWEVKEENIVLKLKNSVFLGKFLIFYVEIVIFNGKILKKDGVLNCWIFLIG